MKTNVDLIRDLRYNSTVATCKYESNGTITREEVLK